MMHPPEPMQYSQFVLDNLDALQRKAAELVVQYGPDRVISAIKDLREWSETLGPALHPGEVIDVHFATIGGYLCPLGLREAKHLVDVVRWANMPNDSAPKERAKFAVYAFSEQQLSMVIGGLHNMTVLGPQWQYNERLELITVLEALETSKGWS